MARIAIEIALYKGDEFIMIGTLAEVAKFLNVNVRTVRFYMTPTWARRSADSTDRIVIVRTDS